MILSRFQWYRRARGGYWAQITAPMRIFSKTKWIRCNRPQPTPDQIWTFYPWATKTMGNGYIDEWQALEPCYAIPLSQHLTEQLGTNDIAAIKRQRQLLRDAVKLASDLECWLANHSGINADWPLRIKADETTATILAEKLNALNLAIKDTHYENQP